MRKTSLFKVVFLCLTVMMLTTVITAQKVKLRFVTHYQEEEVALWTQLIKEYEEMNPDVEIQYETMTWNDYEEKLPVQFAAGVGPDVMYYAARRIVGLANNDYLVDFHDLVARDDSIDVSEFSPAGLEEVTLKGKWYGFASDAGVPTLNYNVNLFQEAGLAEPAGMSVDSWDFDAFVNSAKKISKDKNGDGALDQAGYRLSTWDGDWPSWIFANGGRILDESGRKVKIDEPAATDAMQWYADLVNVHGAAVNGGSLGNQRAGKIGMWLDGAWQVTNYRNQMDFDWNVALPPSGAAGPKAIFFGGGYTISKQSEHIQEAWKFVKFLLSDDVLARRMREVGRFPLRKSVMSEFLDTLGSSSLPPTNREAYIDVYDYAAPLPITPVWSRMRDIIGKEMAPVWDGKVPASEATKRMAEQIEPLLQTW